MNGGQPAEDPAQIQRPLLELAQEVLRNEKAAPGSQDPEFVRWANDKLSGKVTAMPASATPTQQPQAPQPAGSSFGEEHEGVLQIRQMPGQTIHPTEGGNRPDDGQGTA